MAHYRINENRAYTNSETNISFKMNVELSPCHKCDEIVYSRSDQHVWCACGRKWCNVDCAMEEGYDMDENNCDFCTKKDAEDHQLVAFIIQKYNLTRGDLVKEYYECLMN